jgi:hypothetical protein
VELDIRMENDSLSVAIDNPFHLDLLTIAMNIEGFLVARGARLDGIDIQGLLPRMITGIAGCERGCPADAKSLVSGGYKNFKITYIDGGILSAEAVTENNKSFSLRLFPDF